MKQNIWKRFLSMFAAIALLVGLMPQFAVNAEAATNTASRDGFTVKLTAHWVLCNSDGKLVETDAGNYLYYDEVLHFDADDIWIYAKTTGGATIRLNFGMHSLETANNVCVWDHNLSVYIDITDQVFDCTKSQGSNKWTASGVGEEIYTTTQPLTSLGFNANACFRVLWNAEITYTPFGSHDYSKQEVTAGTCAEAGYTLNKCSHGPCSFYTRTEGSKDPNNHAGTISYEPGGNGKHYKKCSACTLNEEQRCSVNAHICGGYPSCSVCGQRTSDTPIKHILSYAYYSMDMNLQPLNSIELMCYRVKDPNASYSSDKHCMTTNTLRLGDNGTCHRMNAGVYYYTGGEVTPYGPVFSGNTEMWDLSNLKYELRYTGDTVNITPDGQSVTCTLSAELPDTKGNITTFTISETYRIVPVEFDDDGFAPTGAYQPAELVDGVYQVANAGNLFWLAQQGNSGAISDASVVLTSDITIPADRIWTPINNGILHFDGQNHTLTIHQDISDTASGENYGLFGSRGYGTVKNLVLEGSIKVNTTGFVGALAGSAFADTYENVVSRVDVTNLGTGATGGLAGYYGGKENAIIRNCAVYADLSGAGEVGGLIGRGWGGTQYYRFYNCAYQGSLTDGTSIGAMVGYNATGNGSSKPNVSMGNIRLQNCYYNPQNEEIPMFGGSYIHEGNSVEYYATITNCGFRSADAFAGGEVAYLLGDAWGQTIGTDAAPVPGGQKVYQVNHCGQTTYSNTNESWEHSFENGFCTRTEGQTHYQPAELVDGAYQITNPGQLYWFGQQVNDGDYDANAVLTADLDLEGREWTTICSTDLYYESTAYSDAVYTGTFDGAGHVIRNYTVRGITGTKCSAGLFGTTLGATVKNLGVENMTFDLNGASDVRAAAIVGQMLPETLIENCYVINSTLTPNNYIVGGVAACNYGGIIRNCFTRNVAVSGHSRCGNLVSDTRGDINSTDRPGTVENCWTDAARVAGTQSGGLLTGCQENVSAARFASGEVAYALGEAFGQTIGTEDHPVLGGAAVYYGYISCAEDAVMVYTNDSTASATPGHHFDENGMCRCGEQEHVTAIIATGWSGDVQWTLTDDGVLTVYGEGVMRNYDYSEKRPWQDYADRITSVVIEEGVTRIGNCALKDLISLETVTLPESGLTRIGEAAFYGCSSLKELYIPDTIYTIWEYTFKKCTALENIRLPKTLEKIDQGAFESCTGLTELFLPTNVNIIGAWSFKGCSGLKEADMQWADATEIRDGAFKNCAALTKITLPANIQVLGDSCFYGIGATTFTVPATVTDIEAWCFARAKVTEIVFEGDAPAIGDGAFNKITLTAYYPGDNTTWTADVMQSYGGTVSWTAK